MNKTVRKLTPVAILLAFAASITVQAAESGDRSGKDVVDKVCSTCHATGANGAPKIGDQNAWKKRSERGLGELTANAIKGIRKMPAHGGNKEVSDLEIERAITFMVNQSGGHWNEPINRAKPVAERTGKQVVDMQCSKCHKSGTGGAPKIGDRDAWIKRGSAGMDSLVRSSINGHGGMPARGGMADLTDSEIRGAVVYMFNQGVTVKK